MIGAHFARAKRLLGAAVTFSEHDGNLGHGRFGIGVKHFRAVADDTFLFLLLAGKKTGDVHQRDDWDIERVAKTDEARCFVRRIDVQAAGEEHRLVGHEADRRTVEPTEADH